MVDQGRRLGRVGAGLDVRPQVQQEAEIAAQFLFAGAFSGGAYDEPTAGVALFAEQDFFQAAAFAIGLDLARDPGVVDRGHEHQETAGKRDVRGDAGALLGDGLLGNLDKNLLAGLEQIADGGQIDGLHGVASVAAAVAAVPAIAGSVATASPAIAPAIPASAFAIRIAVEAAAPGLRSRRLAFAGLAAILETALAGAAAAGRLGLLLLELILGLAILFRSGPIVGLELLVAFLLLLFQVVLFVLFFQIVFFEVVLLAVILFFDLGRRARDVVDGHLAEHGAEIGRAFQRLLLEVLLHLFDGAGLESSAV